MGNSPDISVVLLTFDGVNQGLAKTIEALFEQKASGPFEVIAIDSGSIDGTLEMLRARSEIRLHCINHGDFGHGRTRQMGFDLSRGRAVVFLCQDALPLSNRWLDALIGKLYSKSDLMAVCSRVVPKDGASPLMRTTVMSEWSSSEVDAEVRIPSPRVLALGSPGEVRRLLRLHNISAAYRREALEAFRFEDVEMGEDVLIAREILSAGFAIGFSAGSVVAHSHEYTLSAAFRRNVMDGRFNRNHLNLDTVITAPEVLVRAAILVLKDAASLFRDRRISLPRKTAGLCRSPALRLSEMIGQYIGNSPGI